MGEREEKVEDVGERALKDKKRGCEQTGVIGSGS